MVKETLAVTLARIEERVKSLAEVNSTDHKQIIFDFSELKKHVNDENEKMDARIKECEKNDLVSKVTWKVLGKVGVTTITVITAAVSIIKLILGVR